MIRTKLVAFALFAWVRVQTSTAALVSMRGNMQTRTSVSISLEKRQIRTKTGRKMAYYGHVTVGNPPQTFSVVYDTGSANLIIPGKDCKSAACLNHTRFNPSLSQNAERVDCDGLSLDGNADTEDDELTITFGTGSITGHCMKDVICVDHACTEGTFITTTDETDNPFNEFMFDGVLGLAREELARRPSFSLMSRFFGQHTFRNQLFSVYLSEDTDASEIIFGGIKHEHMASELFWAPVVGTAGYWQVKINDITFDREPKELCNDCNVVVDTGTSQLAGPTEFMDKLALMLDVKRDCSNFGTLPDLGFIFGEHILSLAPSDYITKDDSGSDCEVAFMNIDVPPPLGPLFVFGIPFLQKYYTVYDSSNNRVGFASAQHQGKKAMEILTVDRTVHAKRRLPTFLSRIAVN